MTGKAAVIFQGFPGAVGTLINNFIHNFSASKTTVISIKSLRKGDSAPSCGAIITPSELLVCMPG